MTSNRCDLGMVGLGVMGRNLVLNMADHGFAVAGYDTDPAKVESLRREGKGQEVVGADSLESFLGALRSPRAVMMLVPAGKAVDSVVSEFAPVLDPGDLLIDGGNSHFTDTDRHARELARAGIHFLGVGISGGEKGARYGPSIMPGGPKEAYQRVRALFESVSAKVGDDPCVTWLGPGSAGHYVKMVHNGIEYALIQLLAESYDLMKRGLGLTEDALADTFEEWKRGEAGGYLVEITADIFRRVDEKTGNRLINMIKDQAKQKGTGKWTSQDAMEIQVPVPTIDAAVSVRDLSGFKDERVAAGATLSGPDPRIAGDPDLFVGRLGRALYAAMILAYAQGMAQLRAASERYDYGLDPEAVARIWRGGCIIRAAALEDIRAAYRRRPGLPNLAVDPDLGRALVARTGDLRAVAEASAKAGIAAPAFSSALSYYDGYRSAWSPANLIQAQRDYFGSHTYERVDEEGTFHTEWKDE